MGIWKKISQSNFLIRLKSWEYWPFGIVHFPPMMYWLWLSLKSRSLFFFSASNPGITMGGMFGESKFEVLKKIPPELIPKMVLVKLPVSPEEVLQLIQSNSFSFPVIFKPDQGERGFMVKRIFNPHQIGEYLKKVKNDFLIQELIDLPVECGLFYMRFPNEEHGQVTSIALKEMLSVTGDGKSTLQELILGKERAKLQWEKLRVDFADKLHQVVKQGETVELNSIGNHCLGTKFLNGEEFITTKLSQTFDRISKQIDGFYFGRYDLKCKDIEALQEGNVKIMELNGCGAEPAHIYEPGFSLWKGVKTLIEHWENIHRISVQNHERGVAYVQTKEGYRIYKMFKSTQQ